MRRREKAKRIAAQLQALYPEPPIPLDHSDPYTLLVAVLLSAQCTDERVNKVTPGLFALAATSGAMAGIVATLATNPIDVARTRLQVQGTVCGSSNTLRGVLATLWKEEGPKSLMKGVQPRILATVPSSIMIVTVYEFVKEWSVRK